MKKHNRTTRKPCGMIWNSPVGPKPEPRMGREDHRRRNTSNKCQAFLQISKRHNSHNQEGNKPFPVNGKNDSRAHLNRSHANCSEKQRRYWRKCKGHTWQIQLRKQKEKTAVEFSSETMLSWKTTAYSLCGAWQEEHVSSEYWATWLLLRKMDSNGCFRHMETEFQEWMY